MTQRARNPSESLTSAPKTVEVGLAGRIGDGFVGTAPKKELIRAFDEAGGRGKPRYGELTVCWGRDRGEARRQALERWPIAGMGGPLNSELPLPAHFEQAAERVRDEDLEGEVVCGSDPEEHLAGIRKFAEAGCDHVWVHQIGLEQDGFFRFYEREVLPNLATLRAGRKAA